MPISVRFVVQSTIGLLAVGFLTLLVIVGMTIWLNERSQVYFGEVIEARDTRGSAVELRSAIQTAEASQRGFLLTGNEIYLAPYDSAKAQARQQLANLKRLLAPYPQSEAMVRRLSDVVTEKLVELDNTIALKTDRRDEEAMAVLRTNRGKAMTDEANVFLSGIVQAADERLTLGVGEQRANAGMLRWASIAGAVVIVLVVGVVTVTVSRYTREVRAARDEVRLLAAGLEERVKTRTADLAQARDRAEVLLAEVNHRVANSLSLVASLVKLQANALSDPSAKEALAEAQALIFAVALVHRRLYGAGGDVRFVAMDEYLSGLLEHLETSMRAEGHGASLTHRLESVRLRTDAAVNLGIVVAEWVTNAFKYAYPDRRGEVRVRLTRLPDSRLELAVEDDGVGRREDAPVQGTGLGSRIARSVAAGMEGEIEYLARQPGTTARLIFPQPPTES